MMSQRLASGLSVAQLLSAFTPTEPMIGPTSVPRPPTATHTTASSDFSGDISLGLIMPTCGVYKAPARPEITAA